MFTVLGILSIIGGALIFTQTDRVARLMSIINAPAEIGATFGAVAIGFMLAGILTLCSGKGQKRGLIVTNSVVYLIVAIITGLHINFGDLGIYAVASFIMFVIYLIWLLRHKHPKTPSSPAKE